MKIAFVGDVMLGRLVNETLKTMPLDYPWGDTIPVLRESDLRIGNLECVISDWGAPWGVTPKVFHFRTDAKNIEALKIAGFNLVSIANNHSLDYECEGLFEMIKTLEAAGIHHAGAGANADAACSPAFIEAVGSIVGCVAFTDNEPAWEAVGQNPGVCYVPIDESDGRARQLFELVRQTKKKAGIVIVSAHWGPNWGYQPLPEHIHFGRLLVENGADIVFGHSSHVFRAVEIYRGRPIFYSTGNFVDDFAVDEIERNDESFIFVVETEGTRITGARLYPTMIQHMQARLARPFDAFRIMGRMRRICERSGTASRLNEEKLCLELETG